jgi:hypothetical protein
MADGSMSPRDPSDRNRQPATGNRQPATGNSDTTHAVRDVSLVEGLLEILLE